MNQQETLHVAGSTNAVVTVVVTDHPVYGDGWSVIDVLDTRWETPEGLPPLFPDAGFWMVKAALDHARWVSEAQFAADLLVDGIGEDLTGPGLTCAVCSDKLVPRLVRQVVDLIAAILAAGVEDDVTAPQRAIAL